MEWKRNCPKCTRELNYKKVEYLKRAIRKNQVCRSCSKPDYTGENNPFFGKTHSKETKQKIGEPKKGKPPKFTSFVKGHTGRKDKPSNYLLWIKKYGKEEADIRFQKFKDKQSANNSGKGNPMYGKVTRAGNGYKGWYKGWFFRSLRELSYVYNLDQEGKKWISAEAMNFYIEYKDYKNSDRTYVPDFLVEDRFLVEIKPVKLHTSKSVMDKKAAAEIFCADKHYTYTLIDYPIMPYQRLKELYEQKIIEFTKKDEERFTKYVDK